MPAKDVAEQLRIAARKLPDIEEGMSCTQTSFKRNGTPFLYVGMQGGRYKAMFKLSDSIDDAKQLADSSPDDFQVGSTEWVTARFSNDDPMPTGLWRRWLKESYSLSGKKPLRRKSGKPSKTRSAT